jgi:hypothetical protein
MKKKKENKNYITEEERVRLEEIVAKMRSNMEYGQVTTMNQNDIASLKEMRNKAIRSQHYELAVLLSKSIKETENAIHASFTNQLLKNIKQ